MHRSLSQRPSQEEPGSVPKDVNPFTAITAFLQRPFGFDVAAVVREVIGSKSPMKVQARQEEAICASDTGPNYRRTTSMSDITIEGGTISMEATRSARLGVNKKSDPAGPRRPTRPVGS